MQRFKRGGGSFKKASGKAAAGLSLIVDHEHEELYGLGIALEENEIYYVPAEGLLTKEYLCGKIQDLAEKR